MKALELSLFNFRCAREVILNELQTDLNLFVGVNGAGKTTILDALAHLLSFANARLRSPHGKGSPLQEMDIRDTSGTAALGVMAHSGQACADVSWSLIQTRAGHNPRIPVYINSLTDGPVEINRWAHAIRNEIENTQERCNLPVFVYYPIFRAVLDIPLRIRKLHEFGLLQSSEGALPVGKKAKHTGIGFREFFEWFRNREDLENEKFRELGQLQPDPQLQAVRSALTVFLPEFRDISIKRNPLRMIATKQGRFIRVDQMSDGEKSLLALIGDLARRLAIANPARPNPLQGEGIVLIDEIDLHLHPSWQRTVIPNLLRTFPNCQFFITTHSPQVLGEVKPRCVYLLRQDEAGELTVGRTEQSLGLDSAEILEMLMESPRRDEKVTGDLEKLFDLIDRGEYEAARTKIVDLKLRLHGDIPEIVRAEALLTMYAGE
ncbi:MAG: hypothetical protein CVU65_05680 [Deltaproteobacteria bacterium HGW-Deltaproteobacteria-22]|nr:MAG: hypothetical protein CVU65_05680 [Deltaproteobacteria bacterium HGW-Deltaproteobacteria-22]